MAFRFFRRLKIAPGVSLNLSKSGVSPSFGVPGARLTLGRDGVRRTVGIPGTGLFYTEVDGGSGGASGSRGRRRRPAPAPPAVPARSKLDLGFFQRLLTPRSERSFVEGCKAQVTGDAVAARRHLAAAADRHADAAFLAGFLALDAGDLDPAARWLERASTRRRTLGRLLEKYGLNLTLALPVTDHVVAHVQPTWRGAQLGLVEAYQAQGRLAAARAALERLHRDHPDDVVVRLSLAELLLDDRAPRGAAAAAEDAAAPDTATTDRRTARRVVELTAGVTNESSVHAALLLHRGQALRALGLDTPARDALTAALRRRKDRDPDLLRAIRRERARVYRDLGQRARARGEWERILAEAPDDVEARSQLDH